MLQTVRNHWPEYAIEAGALGTFLVSAAVFTVLFENPVSAVHGAVPSAMLRQLGTGIAMGLTLIALVYSPWGRRSGLHMNPALTLTFFRLGKVAPLDAAAYIGAQFAGASVTMLALAAVALPLLSHESVRFVTTRPGPAGPVVAFAAEAAISFGMMLLVLVTSNSARYRHLTGVLAGTLVAAYITLEAPLSGMSMNPARTFGPAIAARAFDHLWIYFTAPLLGMLVAGEVYVRARGLHRVACAKLHHDAHSRCIFRCGYAAGHAAAARARAAAVPTASHVSPPSAGEVSHEPV